MTNEKASAVESYLNEVALKAEPMRRVLAHPEVLEVFSHNLPGVDFANIYEVLRRNLSDKAYEFGIMGIDPLQQEVRFGGSVFNLDLPEIDGFAQIWDHDGGFGEDIVINFSKNTGEEVVLYFGCGYPHEYMDDEGVIIEADLGKPGFSVELGVHKKDRYGSHISMVGFRGSMVGFNGDHGKFDEIERFDEGFEYPLVVGEDSLY